MNTYILFTNDAAGYIDEEKYDVAACVGATTDCGRCRGDNKICWPKASNWRAHSHRRTVLAWIPQQEDRPRLWRLIRRRFFAPCRAGRLFDQLSCVVNGAGGPARLGQM